MEISTLIGSKRHEELLNRLDKATPIKGLNIDRKIQSAQHKELLEAFKSIIPVDGTPETVKAITELGKKIELFIEAVKDIPAPNVTIEPQQVFVETNQDKMVDSVSQLGREIIDSLNEIKNRPIPVEWVHEITARDKEGMAKKIVSKAIFKK